MTSMDKIALMELIGKIGLQDKDVPAERFEDPCLSRHGCRG
jgi:hypothetical protein